MALPTPDMDDCCRKELCTFGDNKGLAYSTCDPCQGLANVQFDEGKCDCLVYSRYWRFNATYTPLVDAGVPVYDSPSCCVGGTTPQSSSFNTWDIDFGPSREVTFDGWVIDGIPTLSTQVLDEQGACCVELFCRSNANITYKQQFGDDYHRTASAGASLNNASDVLWQSDSGPGFSNGKRSALHARMLWGLETILVEFSDGTTGAVKCIENEWDSLEAIPIDSGGTPL